MTERAKMLETALSQLGVHTPDSRKYMKALFPWIDQDADWCAAFVSWCAMVSGVSEDRFPRHASCTLGRAQWQQLDAWRAVPYTPREGDIIYFDWDRSGDCDHVGVVTSFATGVISTIEGNKGGEVKRASYKQSDRSIAGFAAPLYDERDNLAQSWAQQAVSWAREQGIVLGDETGDLHLGDKITREEVITMLHRAAVISKTKENT